jgi:hypothetical protein
LVVCFWQEQNVAKARISGRANEFFMSGLVLWLILVVRTASKRARLQARVNATARMAKPRFVFVIRKSETTDRRRSKES